MSTTRAALEVVRQAFEGAPRPRHFTNFAHCPECADHDATLLAHTPDTIGLEQLGKPGWDPICFVTMEGYRYYLPGLARLALAEKQYRRQFLFHLDDRRIWQLTVAQRSALLALLEALYEEQGFGAGEHGLMLLEERILSLQCSLES